MPIQSIDTHLGEATVLAVVLHADTRLEAQPLCQAGGVGGFEQFRIHHVNKTGGYPPHGRSAVGRDYHFVEGDVVRLQLEVHFLRGVLLHGYFFVQREIADVFHFDGKCTHGEVLQEIMPSCVGGGANGGAFHPKVDVREMFTQ